MKAFQQIFAEYILCEAVANIIQQNPSKFSEYAAQYDVARQSEDGERSESDRTLKLGPFGQSEVQYDVLNRLTAMEVEVGHPSLVLDHATKRVEYTYFDNGQRKSQTLFNASGTIIDLVYNADGIRISKSVDGVSTEYLVCSNNLTGYAQVLEELQFNTQTSTLNIQQVYTYGLDLISQSDLSTGETHYYLYDGLGSVKSLVDELGEIAVDYQYDAFGNLLSEIQYGTSYIENAYRFTGEQYDADLEQYFLRARYLNTDKGRFHSMDSFEGFPTNPISLHKYLYANAN